jgi:hypothetical protein
VRRTLLLVLLALVALVLAVFGAVVGGLALVLGAVAAVIARRTQRALLILLAVGLLVVVAGVLVTRVDPDECFGECVEIGGWGFDPFILVFAVVNFFAWCLGLFLGRLLRPFIRRTRASEVT